MNPTTPQQKNGHMYPPPEEQLRIHLRKRYLLLLSPPALLFLLTELAKANGLFGGLPHVNHEVWDVVLFIAAALTAVALPILYRVLFARANRDRTAVKFSAFYRFENNSMVLALYTPWIALIASLLVVTGAHMTGIFLLTLYACYVFFPSERRLSSDARVFRVTMPRMRAASDQQTAGER